MNKYKIVLGDWSHDGHNQSENFLFKTNYTQEQIQEAYRESCRKTGLQFHHKQWKEDYSDGTPLFTEYEEYWVSKEVHDGLVGLGIPEEIDLVTYDDEEDEEANYQCDGSDHLVLIILWFISLSLPEDFKYEIIKDDVPSINGWWGKLNHQFGYGLFN